MAVLAMIARSGTRGISRDRLVAMLWPDADEEQGRNALKQALYALRRDSGAGELFAGGADLRLNPDEATCDVVEFERLLRASDLESAVALHDGPFLDGFRLASAPEFDQWVEEQRRGFERACTSALERLTTAARDRGDLTAAVAWGRRLAAMEPFNARFATTLMNALVAAGDRHGALQHARIHEALLEQQLDLPPDRDVVELARRIREAESVPPIAPATLARAEPVRPVTATVPTDQGGEVGSHRVAASHAASPRTVAFTPSVLPAIQGEVHATAWPSVAVLPFACMSAEPDAQHMCDGLAEELIHALGRGGDIRVTGRTSVLPFAGRDLDLREVGARLGVAAVLEGSLRRRGEQVRVTARLVDVASGATLWSERYDRESSDALGFQDDIADAIAAHVDRALHGTAGGPSDAARRLLSDDLYLRGRRHWKLRGGGLLRALDLFRQVVAIDPLHARAHASLADVYTQLAFYGHLPSTKAAEATETALREAFRLEPELAEAHAAQGAALVGFRREYEAGLAAFECAIRLDPSSVPTRYRLAFARLCVTDDAGEALGAARVAADMGGDTGHARVMFGLLLLGARRVDEALQELHGAIDVETPSFLAFHWLAVAYLLAGSPAEAVSAAVAEVSLSERHPWAVANLIAACAAAGQRKRARVMFAGLQARAEQSFVQPSVLALAHAALGELDEAMHHLARALDMCDPTMMMLRHFPMYDPMRRHPAFPALLRRAGFA